MGSTTLLCDVSLAATSLSDIWTKIDGYPTDFYSFPWILLLVRIVIERRWSETKFSMET